MKRLLFLTIFVFIGCYVVILPPTVESAWDDNGSVLLKDFKESSHEMEISKGAPTSPTVQPFLNNRDWILVRNLEYSIGNSGVKISVPKGFVTDFASVPRILWPILSPYENYSRAAIVHDYLYWTQKCTRKQADNIFLMAMKESSVSKRKCYTVYQGVRKGGEPAWNSNKKEREAGLPKIIPPHRLDFPDNVDWKEYRRILFNDGVRDPLLDETPAYCAFGNSTDVPK